ncbi:MULTISPECIES: hypothetical protein [Streptomyces]|uniref:Secreted protein n=1 Tax=Streptomyces chilikensis TaxID=1194079 RepID=A0ABV3EKG2_9ACTN|nr:MULTISPECIES: hypothetical protein [Streptomyces]MDH6225191.1 hypothetical protein [Streptomyces sp. MJP52]
MRTNRKLRAAGAVTAGLALALGVATSASAATAIPIDGHGTAYWQADPSDGTPGDALRVCDTNADGLAVRAVLTTYSNVTHRREVDTAGHSAGYCTPWKTGDLPEGTKVMISTQYGKGGEWVAADVAYLTA